MKKTKTSEAAPGAKPAAPSGVSRTTASGVREVKLAEAKDDWSEKTHTSWSEHSGFIEISKVAKIAPPPRLDPRTVPRPATAASGGLSPQMKSALIVLVLLSGAAAGLYANGVFDAHLRQPASVEAKANETAPTANTPVSVQPHTEAAPTQPPTEPSATVQPASTETAAAPTAAAQSAAPTAPPPAAPLPENSSEPRSPASAPAQAQ